MGDDLSYAAMIAAALTFVLPPIVAALRGWNAPPWVVGLIFFGLCFIFAAVSLFLQDKILDPPAAVTGRELWKYYLLNLLAVITLARVWYSTFWKTLGAGALDGLERTGPQLGGGRNQ